MQVKRRIALLQESNSILTENKACLMHNNSRIEPLRPSKPIQIENEVRAMHRFASRLDFLELLQASKPILTENKVCLTHNNSRIELL